MPKVFLSFEAENNEELTRLVLGYAARLSDLWPVEAPSTPEELEDEKTLSDEEWDAKYDDVKPSPPPDEPTSPEPKPRKPRRGREAVSAPPVSAAPPPPAPDHPAATEAPARELPALDTLKSVVTTAVRLAQKGEGSKKILELLPAFKDTTGLDFVMNAEDKHRAALYDLVSAADLPVV